MAINKQNLIPMNKRTKDEQRRITSKGGKASGEARRERKELRELMLTLLDEDLTMDGEKTNAKVAMAKTLLYSALKDKDLAKIKYIAELIGESPAQRIEVTGKDGKDLNQKEKELTEEEAKEFIKELGREYGWDKWG